MSRATVAQLLAVIAIVTWLPGIAVAKLEPSFHAEQAAWNATHIVVASEGEVIDGRLTVLESWKGDLVVGAIIEVPELKQFQTVPAGTIDRRFTARKDVPDDAPEVVGCQKIVLFLVRNPAVAVQEAPMWLSAMTVGQQRLPMAVSLTWLEGEEVLAMQQEKSPGAAVLMPLTETAQDFHKFVTQVIQMKREIEEIATRANPAFRAAGYKRHVESKSSFARHAAFAGLSSCGQAGGTALQAILRDESLVRLHGPAVAALAKIEGIDTVPLLVEIIEQEIVFWKETALALQLGWWNGKGLNSTRQQELQSCYGRVVEAVFALDRHPDPRAAQAVTRLRDFWRSLPQLDDPSGLNQISETCTSILKKLSVKPGP